MTTEIDFANCILKALDCIDRENDKTALLLPACKAAMEAIETATDTLDKESPEYLTLCGVLVQLEEAINKAEGN
jgi:hypothetical protein